jgi:superfamily II DNA/RNA helicase
MMSRWVKIIFFLSLALNFAVIGVVASKKLGFHKWRHWGMQHHVLKAIPEAKRPEVKKILEDYRKSYPRKRGRMIKNWDQFEKLLMEERFDREKFISAFNQELVQHNERWTNGGKVIADIAELLTVEERKEVLKKFKRKMKWRHRHHKHH